MVTATLSTMYRGDTPTFRITATDERGQPYALTGHSIWVTCKRSKSDVDGSAIFQLTVGSGVTINAAPDAHTADCVPASGATSGLTSDINAFLGVRIRTPGARVYTIFEGVLPIVAGTTQATS